MLGGMMQSIGVGGTIETSELNLLTGNVGIGTASPLGKLHIHDATSPKIILSNDGDNPADSGTIDFTEDDIAFGTAGAYGFRLTHNGSDNNLYFQSGNEATVNTRLTVERDTGNVGIGTTSPSALLNVYGASGVIANFTANNPKIKLEDTNDSDIYLENSNGALNIQPDNGSTNLLAMSQGGTFNFNSGNLYLTSTGNVGIGTAVPSAKLHVNGDVIFASGSELTIASGEITPTHAFHYVDTESDASTDDLDTINGASTGKMLILKAADNGRTIVLKDAVDNLRLAGDFSMDTGNDIITLIGLGTNWYEISRSNNA